MTGTSSLHETALPNLKDKSLSRDHPEGSFSLYVTTQLNMAAIIIRVVRI